jgi:hypothetical protein
MSVPTGPGPKRWVDRFIIERVAQTMSTDGVAGAIGNLVDPDRRQRHFAEARRFVQEAIAAVRTAPDADPAWTDEDIAERIVKGIAAKRDQQRKDKQ